MLCITTSVSIMVVWHKLKIMFGLVYTSVVKEVTMS